VTCVAVLKRVCLAVLVAWAIGTAVLAGESKELRAEVAPGELGEVSAWAIDLC